MSVQAFLRGRSSFVSPTLPRLELSNSLKSRTFHSASSLDFHSSGFYLRNSALQSDVTRISSQNFFSKPSQGNLSSLTSRSYQTSTSPDKSIHSPRSPNIFRDAYKKILLFVAQFSGRPRGWEHFPPSSGESPKDAKAEDPKETGEKRNDSEGSGDKKKKGEDGDGGFGFSTREILLLFGIAGFFAILATDINYPSLTWQEFQNDYLAKKKVKTIKVDAHRERATIIMNDDSMRRSLYIGSAKNLERKLEEFREASGLTREQFSEFGKVSYSPEQTIWSDFGGFLVSMMITGTFFYLITKASMAATGGAGRGGMRNLFSIGKSNARLFSKNDKVNTKFADVAGLPEAKQEVQEFVDFLRSPKKYQELGAKIPKGALLVGPPGTGKTLLAKAAAGEASVPFFSTSGSDFIEMFVGVGPARVRDLFQQARENAPCIVFVDEIDAIGRERGKGGFRGGNDERENTLNQILVEMDGFAPTTGVVILAATNRPDILDKALTRPGRFDRQIALDKPDVKSRVEIFAVHLKPLKIAANTNIEEIAKTLANLTPGFSGADIATNRPDILDKALTRPGRFDRQIALDKPDVKSRVEIFAVHLKPLKIAANTNIEEIAKTLANLTPGFSGADIANVCNEAALVCARRNGEEIVHADFEAAIDRTIGGVEKKTKVLSPEEKKTVAYHEAGHAVSGWFLEHADPVMKVSIVPRGQGLGYSQHLPKDQYLVRKEQLIDMMCTALGGRVAEEIFFSTLTTGAQDDLGKVTKIAYAQITKYGMSDRIGVVAFGEEDGGMRPYSDSTAEEIDNEVRDLVDKVLERTRSLLREKKDEVEKVANLLLEKEIIRTEDLTAILGPRPFHEDETHTPAEAKMKEQEKEKEITEKKQQEGPPVNSPPLDRTPAADPTVHMRAY
eukprot:TRINITY_DN44_c0_g1_i1.p1 TRINITY_DN44_c0_g1~~TRINITY_DN44_c0_g1_i1.p1  ORF type:complete len:901 (+),score=294.90 TRINITY_DN44_c0_g1_i1:290-2992(+)